MDAQRARQLVAQALDEFDDPGVSTSKNLRRCLRIASLRKDYANLLWLWQEALTLHGQQDEFQSIMLDVKSHFTEEEYVRLVEPLVSEYMTRRAAKFPDGKEGVDPRGVGELESTVSMLESAVAGLPVSRDPDVFTARVNLAQQGAPLRAILERVTWRLHRFLMDTETQIEYGQVNADVFERNRAYVDEQLVGLAPDALAAFAAAVKRVQEGDAESLSHALTSCRRVLKAVADKVYPARSGEVTGVDGKARAMTDDKYLNRLNQAVAEALGKHGQGAVLQAVLQDFGKRLSALNDLASKGVHDSVTAVEVDICVIQTYLLVGDILRAVKGESALVSAVSEEPDKTT